MKRELSASEALYGFAGWLTSRPTKVVASSSDDAAVLVDLVAQFCQANNLADPAERWKTNLIRPGSECSGQG